MKEPIVMMGVVDFVEFLNEDKTPFIRMSYT